MSTRIIILAAGQGKRMHSALPKVLHPLASKPLLEHVVTTVQKISPTLNPLVIFGHEGAQVRAALSHLAVQWVEQAKQAGTGDAVKQALPHLADGERVLILYGDVPLISEASIKRLLSNTAEDALGLMTAELPQPKGYGRIVRDAKGAISAIVEEKDADEKTRQIKEINSGIYCVAAKHLKKWLPQLKAQNAQGEFYLTDIIKFALDEKLAIHSESPESLEEILGVNDRCQLNHLERYYQQQQAQKLMRQGVTLADPARFDLRGEAEIAADVFIDINVILEGRVVIGKGSSIGPNVLLRNTIIGEGVEIRANSVLDGAEVASECIIGPFARLRPGTVLAPKAHVGNFVEIKNSVIDEGSKVPHLSYVGDSDVGKGVNIGAGVITCNYDGVNKHRSLIADGAFIGSGSQLIAPISVGKDAFVAAGSTISKDAPAEKLTVARAKQITIEGWKRPGKNKEKLES